MDVQLVRAAAVCGGLILLLLVVAALSPRPDPAAGEATSPASAAQ